MLCYFADRLLLSQKTQLQPKQNTSKFSRNHARNRREININWWAIPHQHPHHAHHPGTDHGNSGNRATSRITTPTPVNELIEMASSMLNLRIRGPEGSSTIKISSQAAIGELYEEISNQTHISKASLEVRVGYPNPQAISPSDMTATVESIGIKNGEVLQASCSQPPPSSHQPPAPSTPAHSTPLAARARVPNDVERAPAKSSLSSLARVQDQSTASPSVSKIDDHDGLDSVSASVALEAGHLVLRVVPDDNSCLFRAVGILLDHGQHHSSTEDLSSRLRRIVADAVKNDPVSWCEPILGRDPDLYISKILDKDVWGGAIELAILADHFKTEICSIDVQTGRVDRFGQSNNYANRIFLVYSGIHYDAISLSPIPPEELSNQSTSFPPELDFDTTIFASDEDSFLHAALQLVSQLRQMHYYTDTASFSLRCEICKTALVGEKDARSHAESTGHTQFGEYA